MKIVTRSFGRDATVETDDGRVWREATPAELDPSVIAPETLIWFGRGEPHAAGEYADMVFPGRYPFLPGLVRLGPPVYVVVPCPVCGSSPCEIYRRGGHRLQYCWCGSVLPCEKGHSGERSDNC